MRGMSGTLRIIAGAHRGRRIKTIDAPGTRPMTDRVRESLFNILGEQIAGGTFLDLFAGSGAVGIEALSRGAASATFVESDHSWCRLIVENIGMLNLDDQAEVMPADAYKSVAMMARKGRKFDIVFAGAPYDEDHHNRILNAIINEKICADDGLIVLQFRKGDPLNIPPGFDADIRKYGITALAFIRRSHESE